jgi:PAS domain S-box-containing protein
MIPIGIIGGINGFQSTSMFLIGLILLVTFVVSFIISYLITKPIVKLTKNIDEISKGKLDVDLESSEIYEINNLTESLNRIMASLKLAIKKVEVKKDEIFEETTLQPEASFEKKSVWSNQALDSVFVFDEKANIVECSENMYKKLGYTKDEILTLSISDLYAIDSREEFFNKMKQAKKNGTFDFKTILKTKKGSPVFVHEQMQYLEDEKKYKCIIREDFNKK